jgi:hypothetical protein
MKNDSLIPLSFLIGKWNVEMKHSSIPNSLNWEDTFEWVEDSFIIWHWQGKNEVPKSISIIGRNEEKSGDIYTMLYYDQRGISRRLEMSFDNGTWKYWRMDPDFSQRFEASVSNEGTIIKGEGETSKDNGKTWEHDFFITYTKLQ